MTNPVLQRRLRTVNWVGAGLALLILSGTAALGVYPMWEKGKGYNRDSETLIVKTAELGTLSEALQNSQRSFQDIQARLAAREEQLPSWDKEPNFYGNELTKIKKAVGVQLATSDLSRELKPWNGYRVGSIELRGSGDWNSCMKFLAEIHAMKGLARLDTLMLDVSRDSSVQSYDQPRCEFRVSFSIFFKGG